MVLPDFETIMLPFLEFAKDGNIHSINGAEEYLSHKFNLTKSERKQLKPSGGETTFFNRIRWARLYLKHANLIQDPKLAHYQITEKGAQVLKQRPEKINTEFLMRFKEFKEWFNQIRAAKTITKKKITTKELPKKLGFVVFLDALGTKGIWKRTKNIGKTVHDWNFFTSKFEQIIKLHLKKAKVTFHSFSDTIIITIETSNAENTLLHLASSICYPLIYSMMLGMPLRGCISYGVFYHGMKLIVGPAVDEAAEYYEQPQWIGISATASVHRLIETIRRKKPAAVNTLFYKCDVPLKNSLEQDAWAIKWADVSDEWIKDNPTRINGILYEDTTHVINSRSAEVSDLGAVLKWRNTKRFYEDIVRNQQNRMN